MSKLARASRDDLGFRVATGGFGVLLVGIVMAIGVALTQQSWLAIHKFGLSFWRTSTWDPVAGEFGALPFIWGTLYSSVLALLVATPVSIGIAVFIVGVTMVKGFETEQDVRMNVGETATIGGYTFRFDGVQDVMGPNYTAARGTFHVIKDGRETAVMYPEKRRYTAQNQVMTEAAIDTGLLRDLYVSLGEPIDDGAWSVRLYHKPFIDWIWGGCLIMALGGVVAVSDRRYRPAWRREPKPVPAGARLAGRQIA